MSPAHRAGGAFERGRGALARQPGREHHDVPDGVPDPARQNKASLAVHLKLDEIVAAIDGANNRLINIDDLTGEEVRTLLAHDRVLVEIAKVEESLTRSHSIGEASARAFYPPTLLTGVRKGMPAFDEETFGPVAAVTVAHDEWIA